ncbi:MAG: EbsA family protein [Lactobacillales bacterium]|jgi:hypothetical protein|nr:EbsA family protein [Lactobacillales bacterium]
MKPKKYKFQPEFPLALAYWASVFAAFLIGVMMLFSLTSLLQYIGIFIVVICLGFAWVGIRRFIWIEDGKLSAKTVFTNSTFELEFKDITKLETLDFGLRIYSEKLAHGQITITMVSRDYLAIEKELMGKVEEIDHLETDLEEGFDDED